MTGGLSPRVGESPPGGGQRMESEVDYVLIDPSFEPIFRAHPLVLVDVGARGGPRPNWRLAKRHLRYVGFEPDRDEFARLAASGAITAEHRILNVALHNRPGPVRLHVARSGGLSWIFEPHREFIDKFPDAGRFDTIDSRTIEADRLDHQLALHGIDGIDFIKADTQGSEVLVLEGASESAAFRGKGLTRLRGKIAASHIKTCANQSQGHRQTHHAEADEGDRPDCQGVR